MSSWLIFRHALQLIGQNFRASVRIYAPLQVPLALLGFLLQSLSPDAGDGTLSAAEAIQAENYSNAIAILALLQGFFTLWIAVAWHRFILRNEPIRRLPKFRGRRILFYFLWGATIGFFCLLVPGLPMLVFLLVKSDWTGAAPNVLMIGLGLLGLPLLLVAAVLSLRLSTILPGIALGTKISLKRVWDSTRGANLTCFGLIVLTTFTLSAAAVLTAIVSAISPVTDLIGSLIYDWFATMLSVSILTTLFGHYVQKRPLG